VTLNEQSGPAVDEQFTLVIPTGKNEPDDGAQVIVPQLASPVGEKVATAPHWLGSLALVMFAGQVIPPQEEATVTVKVQEAVLLDVSVAVQVTVVVPAVKQVPEGGEQEAVAPGQLSIGAGVV
jgi:hypothetical protein